MPKTGFKCACGNNLSVPLMTHAFSVFNGSSPRYAPASLPQDFFGTRIAAAKHETINPYFGTYLARGNRDRKDEFP